MFNFDYINENFGDEIRSFASNMHHEPELSNLEFKTTNAIREKLVALGIEILDLPLETGVVGIIRGGEGTAVALRADIDAIPQNECTGRTDSSIYKNVMHGCGHDTHTAGLLGAAMALSKAKDKLKGDVVLIFQPAEENLSGAKILLNAGIFEKTAPKFLFGLHNYPEFEVGTLGLRKGSLMASKDTFEVRLIGKSGHVSMPHKNIDPIVAMSAVIQGIQTIISKNVPPLEAAVVAITQVHAGTKENSVVDDAYICGNIRTLDKDVREVVLKRFREIVTMVGEAYGCQVDLMLESNAPNVYNSEFMFDIAKKAGTKTFGEKNLCEPPLNLASEDFAVLGEKIPSFFFFLGSGAHNAPVYSWHNAKFDTDENTPVYGATLLANCVFEAQEMI